MRASALTLILLTAFSFTVGCSSDTLSPFPPSHTPPSGTNPAPADVGTALIARAFIPDPTTPNKWVRHADGTEAMSAGNAVTLTYHPSDGGTITCTMEKGELEGALSELEGRRKRDEFPTGSSSGYSCK